MAKRIMMVGAVIAVLAAALILSLSILDIISFHDLKEILGKTLSIVAVSTIALLLIFAIVKIGRRVSQ